MNTVLRVKDLIQKLNISRSSLYKLIKEGKFPKPISLGARSVGWNSKTVDDWLDDRAKQANQGG